MDDILDDQQDTSGWYSEDNATFGDRLAAAREAAGMTASELARRVGVKQKTLRNWEEDLSEPRGSKLQMLAGLLNVSLGWLLTGIGEDLPEPQVASDEVPDLRDLLLEIRDIKLQMSRSSDQLGRLEKRLRKRMEGHLG